MSDQLDAGAAPKHPPAPRVAPNASPKLRSMPLSPKDAFVLSWIDGKMFAHDIIDACGLDAATVTEALSRLTAIGLIDWGDVVSIAPPSMPAPERRSGRVSGTRLSTLRNIDTISAPTRKTSERFAGMTHYDLLGVQRTSTEEELEEAHALAANLEAGTPAARMAAHIGAKRVLDRVAIAYDALRVSESKRRYDEYLLLKQETRAIEDALSEGARRASLVPARDEASKPTVASARPSGSRGLSAANINTEYLVSAVRRHAAGSTRRTRAEGLIRDAIAERKDDNLVGATNALRLASSIVPGCEALECAVATVAREMRESLASTFRDQAMREESLHMWKQAAETWEKVLQGIPGDARAARGAAEALLEAGGDLERAQRHAERAVASAPRDQESHRTLARVFIASGMTKQAERSLNIAQGLGVDEPEPEGVLQRLRKRWRSA